MLRKLAEVGISMQVVSSIHAANYYRKRRNRARWKIASFHLSHFLWGCRKILCFPNKYSLDKISIYKYFIRTRAEILVLYRRWSSGQGWTSTGGQYWFGIASILTAGSVSVLSNLYRLPTLAQCRINIGPGFSHGKFLSFLKYTGRNSSLVSANIFHF